MNSLLKITKIFSLVTLCFFTSCKSSSEKTDKVAQEKTTPYQKLKINIVSEPYNLDPRKARSLNDVNISKMFMEGLTRINKQDEAVLAQAASISVSDDQLSYTIKIKDTKWTNGDVVSSSDFAYAWKKVLSPDFVADNAYQLFVIKNAKDIKNGDLPTSLLGVSCPDEKTLVIELEHPVPYFSKLLALPVFFPVNQKTDKKNPNWSYSVETYVSNGPFKMGSWVHHDKIVALKNPGYWDKSGVKLEEIEMVMVSEDTGIKMFESSDLDWEGSPFSALPVDSIPYFESQKMVEKKAALATYFVSTNTKKKPFESVNIRKAFAFAIDRATLVNHALHGSQTPTTGLVPISMGLQSSPYFPDNNPTEANTLLEKGLKELSFDRSNLSSITLSYPVSDKSHRIAQVLQQQWLEKLNVLVELVPLEPKVFLSNLSQKNFDLALCSWFADFNDPVNFLEVYSSTQNGSNRTQWEDGFVYTQIKDSYAKSNPLERIQTLKNVEKCLIDAMPIIPLANHDFLYVKKEKIKDVFLSGTGEIDFRSAYLEN
jgi:oligopeptide transport system substrate-binding protein